VKLKQLFHSGVRGRSGGKSNFFGGSHFRRAAMALPMTPPRIGASADNRTPVKQERKKSYSDHFYIHKKQTRKVAISAQKSEHCVPVIEKNASNIAWLCVIALQKLF
jgi:hypothetical protein